MNFVFYVPVIYSKEKICRMLDIIFSNLKYKITGKRESTDHMRLDRGTWFTDSVSVSIVRNAANLNTDLSEAIK